MVHKSRCARYKIQPGRRSRLLQNCYQIKIVDGYMYIAQPNASSGIRSRPTPGGIQLCSVRAIVATHQVAIVATVPSCISAELAQQTTTLYLLDKERRGF